MTIWKKEGDSRFIPVWPQAGDLVAAVEFDQGEALMARLILTIGGDPLIVSGLSAGILRCVLESHALEERDYRSREEKCRCPIHRAA